MPPPILQTGPKHPARPAADRARRQNAWPYNGMAMALSLRDSGAAMLQMLHRSMQELTSWTASHPKQND